MKILYEGSLVLRNLRSTRLQLLVALYGGASEVGFWVYMGIRQESGSDIPGLGVALAVGFGWQVIPEVLGRGFEVLCRG